MVGAPFIVFTTARESLLTIVTAYGYSDNSSGRMDDTSEKPIISAPCSFNIEESSFSYIFLLSAILFLLNCITATSFFQ